MSSDLKVWRIQAWIPSEEHGGRFGLHKRLFAVAMTPDVAIAMAQLKHPNIRIDAVIWEGQAEWLGAA